MIHALTHPSATALFILAGVLFTLAWLAYKWTYDVGYGLARERRRRRNRQLMLVVVLVAAAYAAFVFGLSVAMRWSA